MFELGRFVIARCCFAAIPVSLIALPFVKAQEVAPGAAKEDRDAAKKTFLDSAASKEDRLKAAAGLGYPDRETFVQLLKVGKDSEVDDQIRWEALRRHPWSVGWVEVLLGILNNPEDGDEEFRANLVKALSQRTVRVPDAETRQSMQRTYRKLLDDRHEAVREAAYFALVSTEDPVAIAKLVDGLEVGGAKSPIALESAIELIDVAGATRHFNTLRPYLSNENPKVQAVAARVLAADPTSRPKIVQLVGDQQTPDLVRVSALRGMGRFDESLSSYAIPIIRDSEEPIEVRQAAMQAMVGQVNYKKTADAVEVEFAEAVEAFKADPKVESANDKSKEQAETLLENLRKTSPAIRRHYDSDR